MQDEDVQTVVNELSAWMCEARTEMGMTQSRVSYGDFWCMGDIEKVAYPAD